MKIFTNLIIGAAAACAAFPVWGADSVLSVSDDTMQPTVCLPESFETDTRAMLENWYLQTYLLHPKRPKRQKDGRHLADGGFG